MWQMTLPGLLGRLGWLIEHRLAPPFYRRTTIATLSNSSQREIEERMHLHRIAVVPPGISPTFVPGAERSLSPLVVAVGRLVPVKRFDQLIESFVEVHKMVPESKFVIVGEGYMRTELEELIAAHGANEWISLPGRISDDELLSLYQGAWLVSSMSLREGWGMSLTEAAACGTPSVAVDIAGHRDAVKNGESGLLVESGLVAETIAHVLLDDQQLKLLRLGALDYAQSLTWDSAALQLFQLLSKKH
jgi:glycosyltransferase involved in cell wall biosynthesis